VHVLAIVTLVQMPWTSHLPAKGVALDFLRPKFDGAETSLTSAAAYLSGRFPIGGAYSLHFELPFAHLGASGTSSTTLGNPYIGLEAPMGQVTYEAGFRPALTSDDESAAIIGLFSDVSRFEAFTPHVATLSGRITYRNQTNTGVTVEAGAGPSVWIGTAGGDTEVILHHYASFGYRGAAAWTAVGFGGLFSLTSDDGGLAERTIYQIGASLGLTRGSVRPALHAIVPLDDAVSGAVNFVIGLGAAVSIK
jgi:hypothetical protein